MYINDNLSNFSSSDEPDDNFLNFFFEMYFLRVQLRKFIF